MNMRSWLRASAFLTVTVWVFAVGSAHADYKFCALREGPRGPCTCQSDADKPGQYTVVKKSLCRRSVTKPKDPEPEKPAEEKTAGNNEQSDTSDTPTQPAAAEPEKQETGASASETSKLSEIKARGKLKCGVNGGLLGFSAQANSGEWSGIDADFCRAVAAAVLGDGSKVEFIALETNERFDALTTGKIDLLARNTTWTMNREIDLGLRFAGVLYFDGQGFMVRDERGLVSAQQLSGLKVCVQTGTTSEANMQYYFKAHQIDATVQSIETHDEIVKAYEKGDCEVYSGDRSALYSDRASFAEPTQHTILPEIISKEPLGPVVLKSDEEWLLIVRWTLAALINAEEVGLDRASAAASQPVSDDAQRLIDGAGASGEKLDLSKTWLRDVIASVGNYGEMFEADLGKQSPLGMNRGLNALWKRGGILYAPPMW